MIDQAFFQSQAVEMACIQADYLVRDTTHVTPDLSLPQAVGLIHDCVHHLDLPVLAIEIALGFHPVVERWSAWGAWADALDMLLALDHRYRTTVQKIRLLNCRSQAARGLGDFATASATATMALQLAEVHHEVALAAEALNKLGAAAFEYDDLVQARAYWEQAYARAKAHLPSLELGHVSMNLGTIAVRQNRFPDAHQHFNQALQHYRAQNDQIHIAKVQCNLADLCLREGHMAEVPSSFLAALDVLRAMGARYEYALAENDLGYFYLHLRQWEPALAAFRAALVEFEHLGALNAKARVLSNVAELYVTTEQWEKAEPAIREARDLATICERPVLVAAIDVDWGRMLAARGDAAGARRVWEGALVVQEAKGAQLAARHTRQLIDALAYEHQ